MGVRPLTCDVGEGEVPHKIRLLARRNVANIEEWIVFQTLYCDCGNKPVIRGEPEFFRPSHANNRATITDDRSTPCLKNRTLRSFGITNKTSRWCIIFGRENHEAIPHYLCLESSVFVENHLRGCYSNHSIIAKRRALVYRAGSTMEFLTVFIDNQSCLKHFSCLHNTRYHK